MGKKCITIDFDGEPLELTLPQANYLALLINEAVENYKNIGCPFLAEYAVEQATKIYNNEDYREYLEEVE